MKSFYCLLPCALLAWQDIAAGADYAFEFLSVPGYDATWGEGINNKGAVVLRAGPYDSFLRSPDRTYTLLVDPVNNPTIGIGLNNEDTVVGRTRDGYIGFIRTSDRQFSTFIYPGAVPPNGGMEAAAINDYGVVAGSYEIRSGVGGSFIRRTNGEFESFQYLGQPTTSAYGINNLGQVVGFSGNPGGGSFVRKPDGTFIPIDAPGASETQAYGINNLGQVVGYYETTNSHHGFVLDPTGVFQNVDVAGALFTVIWGINDLGQLSGYAGYYGSNIAFIATPIGPPTITCPTNLAVEFSSEAGASVPFKVTAAPGAQVTCFPPSEATFPIGVTLVFCAAADGAGRTNSCAFTVTVLGAFGVKSNVLVELSGLPAPLDPEELAAFQRAVGNLASSLEGDLWIDQTHLSLARGNRAFQLEKNAVNGLEKLLEAEDWMPSILMSDYLERIIRSDRLLAVIAIQDATVAGANAKKIELARRDLAKGDAAIAVGRSEDGIEQYRNAWQHALLPMIDVASYTPAGGVELEILGDALQVYSLQTSTNLVDWKTVGLSFCDGNGETTCIHSPANKPPCSYYRILPPEW